jgi:hypothetical protein
VKRGLLGLLGVVLGLALAQVAQAAPAGLPAAVSETTPQAPATLYFHLIDSSDFPINTQVPDPAFTEARSMSLAAETLTCLPAPPAGGNPFQAYHTWRGYSSPSYVEYGFAPDGHPRVFPERQMGYDGSLAGGAPVLHWFLATRPGPGPAGDAPVVVPNVVVEAAAHSSEGALDIMDKSEAGPLLFSGQSPPALLAMDQTQGANHTLAGSRHVYEIAVPLAVARPALGGAGFVLRVDVRMDAPLCGDADHAAMPNLVEPFADAGHRPRIELMAADPLRVVQLAPRFANGTVRVTGLATALWGNYDVDESNLTLAFEGPAGRHYLPPDNVTLRTHEHGHHADPLNATWTLPTANLPKGLYWLDWTVSNDQHTATATAHAAFRLGPDVAYDAPESGGPPDVAAGEEAMPAGPFVAPLALALAVGLACTRRGRR